MIVQINPQKLGLSKYASKITMPDNFWARVDKSGDCWLWTGRTDENGYGRVGYRRQNNVGAHRVSWALTHGSDLPDRWVLHRCDNPPCVNPGHLFLGDALANNRDRQQKGRTRGWAGHLKTDHYAYFVTDDLISAMRAMRAERYTQREISAAFGVSRGYVSKIVSGVLPRHAKGIR